MAAGEDQPQPIVLNILVDLRGVGLGNLFESAGDLKLQGIESASTPQSVDRLEASGANQPGPRVRRHSFLFPTLDGGGKRLVHRFFGQIEIPHQANQRGEHTAHSVR